LRFNAGLQRYRVRLFTDPRGIGGSNAKQTMEAGDPACTIPTLVSTGGPFPASAQTLAVRWTGYANFELVYNGQILLLDTYFDRGSMYPPLGFKAADVKRADVILIGHGHVDHMSDAASVGARTKAVVVGAPVTTEKLLTQAIDPTQVRTVTGRGGEVLQFKGCKVEPILGRHGEPPADVVGAFDRALKSVATQPTAEQTAELASIRQRGTSDKRVLTKARSFSDHARQWFPHHVPRQRDVANYQKAAMALRRTRSRIGCRVRRFPAVTRRSRRSSICAPRPDIICPPTATAHTIICS
jgi:hypothetical protein